MTGILPMSPLPKSISSPQIATTISGGTPNFCSMRDSSEACRCSICRPMLMRPGPTRVETYCSNDLVEGAALAAVEGQHRRILRHARSACADHACETPAACRLLRHRRHEGVEIAAAAGGVSGGGADDGAENKWPDETCACESLVSLVPIMPWESGAARTSSSRRTQGPIRRGQLLKQGRERACVNNVARGYGSLRSQGRRALDDNVGHIAS